MFLKFLLDGDALRARSSGLGNEDTKDPVLQASLDVVLVDAVREAERAMELAERALREPVRRAIGLVLLSGYHLVLSDCCLSWNSARHSCFSLHGSLVVAVLALSDAGLVGLPLDQVARASAFLSASLSAALDGQGSGVRELNVDVFLVDTWQLSLHLICILHLFDVDTRLERADAGQRRSEAATCSVGGVVVQETEEWSEFAGWEAREERHVVRVGVWYCFADSEGLW